MNLVSQSFFTQVGMLTLLSAPAAASIEYEDIVFTDSGFHARHKQPSVYEGPRTHEQDNAWMNLTTGLRLPPPIHLYTYVFAVGFVSLNEGQNRALVSPSVESMTHPGEYPVAIGVFHQLHCLNYIRVQLFPKIYKSGETMSKRHEGPATGQKETDEMMEQHKRK